MGHCSICHYMSYIFQCTDHGSTCFLRWWRKLWNLVVSQQQRGLGEACVLSCLGRNQQMCISWHFWHERMNGNALVRNTELLAISVTSTRTDEHSGRTLSIMCCLLLLIVMTCYHLLLISFQCHCFFPNSIGSYDLICFNMWTHMQQMHALR